MSEKRVYSFKSVGETPSSLRERSNQQIKTPPIGIKTPLELGIGQDGLFKMHYRIEDAIADNFKNLILTNKGERLLDYDFGANLKELAFELGNEDTDLEAIRRIKEAASRYLSYIKLDTFESFTKEAPYNGVANIGVRITYSVPVISNQTKQIEVIIYSVG